MAAYCSPFAILVHSHLGLEWGATAAGRFYHEEDDEGGGERQRHFNPRQANIIVCDEDPTVSLVEEVKLCEENGWEALLLAAKELTRLFPELWSTRKAAEDWSRKNPLNPCISIIRVWGSLTLTALRARRAGQRRCCGIGPIRGRRSRRCWRWGLGIFG